MEKFDKLKWVSEGCPLPSAFEYGDLVDVNLLDSGKFSGIVRAVHFISRSTKNDPPAMVAKYDIDCYIGSGEKTRIHNVDGSFLFKSERNFSFKEKVFKDTWNDYTKLHG